LYSNATLVKVELITGRTHQIRVHSAFMGNSVIGDKKYGDKTVNYKYRKLGLKRMFLHAKSLNFFSPVTKKRIIIEAKLEANLVDFLDKLD
jgi:23S rRNA pseudouridine955/2504/2580 synthase